MGCLGRNGSGQYSFHNIWELICPPYLKCGSVLNVHLEELSCLLVGETSHLGVVLGEQDGSDSPNS